MVSSGAIKKPKPLSGVALRQYIVKALDKGWIRESYHSEIERASRNISHDDLLCGLEADWLLEEARYSEAHGSFSYTLKTVDIDGDELHVVVCPDSNMTLKVVSKW